MKMELINMVLIPKEALNSDTMDDFKKHGIDPLHIGKVRNSYPYPERSDLRIVEATNRISIFDFVLNA